MEPVRVGFVGLGWWGAELCRGALVHGAIEPVACHARSVESREAFSERFGAVPVETIDELFDRVEAVVVATPHSTHADIVDAALRSGKHVFVDKPFTMTVDDGRRCIQAAERANKVLQVGHQRRRQTPTRRIREMIDGGELGTPIVAEANYSSPGGAKKDPDNWRQDRDERPLSGLTPFGVHVIDAFHYLLGPISAVTAVRGRPFGASALDDAAVFSFEFASGAVGTLVTSTAVPTTTRLGVMGTAGAAWNDRDGELLLVQEAGSTVPRVVQTEAIDAVAEQMLEFATCVRGGERPEVDGRAGLMVTAVVVAALQAASTGTKVEVAHV